MKYFFTLLICVFLGNTIFATQILSDVNFSSGNWALIGIPVHNHRLLPIQEELGTFIIKDKALLGELKQDWNLPPTLEDKCDYHYSLKLYHNGTLFRTFKLNLYCGYLSYEGLSYEFKGKDFQKIESNAKTMNWSRISFGDMTLLKKAIQTLNRQKDIYWYEDVQQYLYPGYFLVGYNGLAWNAPTDSLQQEVKSKLIRFSGSQSFYLKEQNKMIRSGKMSIRYMVCCHRQFADRVPRGKQMLSWRSHLSNTDSIRVVAIGLGHQKYMHLMKGRN